MLNWRKGIAQWRVRDVLYLSVIFTWDLPIALKIAKEYKHKTIVGGPAVKLMPDYLSQHAKVEYDTEYPALAYHNPMATFTTRGCPNRCSFCAVPKIEGEFREMQQWDIKPVVCDNNFLASSKKHFEKVIEALKKFTYVDFNQGLDARLFTSYHANKLSELRGVHIRFAFDHISQEKEVTEAVSLAKKTGFKDISICVLVGFEDTPEDAIYRLEYVRSLDAMPNPMRYQPLYTLEKNQYVHETWTSRELANVIRYYSRLIWLDNIPFTDYSYKNYDINKQLSLIGEI
uniref:Putative radical SAM superfamily protein n=1 Tax=viral metagenome TaxID=1070528 RepID=A0A6H1Z8V4_9ZZZZ